MIGTLHHACTLKKQFRFLLLFYFLFKYIFLPLDLHLASPVVTCGKQKTCQDDVNIVFFTLIKYGLMSIVKLLYNFPYDNIQKYLSENVNKTSYYFS